MRASRLLLRQRTLLWPLVVRSSPLVPKSTLLLQTRPTVIVLFRPLSNKVNAQVLQDETDLLLASQEASGIVGILHRWQSHPDPQHAAKMSETLLHHWLSYQQKSDTSEPFLLVMKAWHKVNDSGRTADVLELWTNLLEGDLELAPTREAYHILLKTFAKQGGPEESLSLLEYMERMQSVGNLSLEPPDTETYAHVLRCLTRRVVVERRNAQWQQVQTMLERLNAVYHEEEPRNVYFRLQAYSQVVCFAVSMDIDALTLLQEMTRTDLQCAVAFWKHQEEEELEEPSHLVGIAYQSVLSKLLTRNNAKQMDALITQLEKDAPNDELPWPQHYNMTIVGWSKTISDKPEAALGLHCEELLQRMEERHVKNDSLKQISLETYERVLWIYMKCQHPAEQLLAHVMALLEANKILRSERHLTACWNHCLKAYFDQDQPDGTLKLWHRMQSMNITPDSVTYDFVLLALSRSTQPDSAAYAQHILTSLKKSNMATATHYATVLVALSRSSEKGAAASAQALLEELEEAHDETGGDELQLTTAMYNAVIVGWGRSRQHDAAIQAERVLERMKERSNNDKRCPVPNVISYNAVLDALSRQRNSQAAEEAESMLKGMESPQQMSYTSVMTAWARSGSRDAPERVMVIYNRLLLAYKESGRSMFLRPDEATFGLLLDMWAKSKRIDAGERAEAILRDMQQNNVAANLVNYNNVILAHARSKQGLAFGRAEALLREMEEHYSAGNETVKPNTVTHTNVIQALKRSQIKDKAQTAWDLLRNMLRASKEGNEDVRPNVITFNSVITACAYTIGDDETRERAVKLALAAVAEMEKQDIAPNSTTFRMLLEAMGRQISDMSERTRMAAIAFHRCRRENLVDPDVVDALRKFVPMLYEQVSSQLELATDPVNMK